MILPMLFQDFLTYKFDLENKIDLVKLQYKKFKQKHFFHNMRLTLRLRKLSLYADNVNAFL